MIFAQTLFAHRTGCPKRNDYYDLAMIDKKYLKKIEFSSKYSQTIIVISFGTHCTSMRSLFASTIAFANRRRLMRETESFTRSEQGVSQEKAKLAWAALCLLLLMGCFRAFLLHQSDRPLRHNNDGGADCRKITCSFAAARPDDDN
jgi:hypothetical protein